MKLDAAAIVLRPRSTAEIFDLACRFAGTTAFGLYARLALVALVPGFALCLALRYAAGWSWPAVWAVALVVGTPAQGVFTVAAGRMIFSEELGARASLALFRKRFISYTGALILRALILAAAALPFFLGLPFAWVRLLHVHEVSLLEAAPATQAIGRAGRFVAGRGGSVFLVLLALLLAHAGILVVTELLGQALLDDVLQLGTPFGTLQHDHGSPAALLGFFLGIPFVATARFLEYIDARTRTDGWDIQLRFMAVVARASAERRAA